MIDKRFFSFSISLIILGFLTFDGAIAADKRELLGSYRNWDALQITHDSGDKTCYIISTPTQVLPVGANRGDIYAMITIRPRVRIVDEVNIVVGYPLRAASEVRASIGGRTYKLFTEGTGAWLRTPSEDATMVAAMRAGNTLTVRGTSSRGTNTTDKYSLAGFTAAHNAIKEACQS